MTTFRRAVALGAATIGILMALAVPALADDLRIRTVDTSRYPIVHVSALVNGPAPDLSSFIVRENGRVVRDIDVVPIGRSDTPVGVVLVLDVSGSMRSGSKLDQAKRAAGEFLARRLPNEQVAIVVFSDRPRVLANFSTDAGALRAAVDALQPESETALYDGVRMAAGLLSEHPELQPNIVVLSDGKDTTSTSSLDEARAAATGAKAAVFTIGVRGGGDFDAQALRSLAGDTGGAYVETTDATQLGELYRRVHERIENQYRITYRSEATVAASGPIDLSVSAAGLEATASVTPGSVSSGTSTRPEEVAPAGVPGPLTGGAGRVVIFALAFLAAAFGAVGLILIGLRRQPSDLDRALQPYGTGGTAEPPAGRERGQGLAQTALLRMAVDATGRFAHRQGALEIVERKLEQANLPLRAPEALFFWGAAVAMATVVGLSLFGGIGAFAALVLIALAPAAALNFKAAARQRAFTSQLPDTLQLLSSTLRAGYSLMQGIEAVAQEVDDPMGRELERVVMESRLGRAPEDALQDVANRMKSPDFDWAVMAIRIQREVGGNLAELLQTVSDTMVSRERLRREIRALTAEGRYSAIILGLMPIAMGAFISATNPGYLQPLFSTGMGQALLVATGTLGLFGFWWLKKTIEIEV